MNTGSGFISVDVLNEAGEKPLSVQFSQASLEIGYDPSRYTPELERQMNEQLKAGESGAMLSSLLMAVMVSWKVNTDKHLTYKSRKGHFVEEDGKRVPEPEMNFAPGDQIPLNERTLDQVVGIFAQTKIVRAIMEDQRPNEEESQPHNNSW